MSSAQAIIDKLGLEAHPEGGWFRETWRSEVPMGDNSPGFTAGRASATAIHFLLEASQKSAWHRVDAAEIWLWHAGDPLLLSTKPELEDASTAIMLGPDVLAGQQVQHVIAPGEWQAAEPVGDASKDDSPAGWTLVSCIVSPGFEFSGFEMAD